MWNGGYAVYEAQDIHPVSVGVVLEELGQYKSVRMYNSVIERLQLTLIFVLLPPEPLHFAAAQFSESWFLCYPLLA